MLGFFSIVGVPPYHPTLDHFTIGTMKGMVFGTPHVEKSSPSGSQVGRSQCTVPKHGIYHLYVYTSIHL